MRMSPERATFLLASVTDDRWPKYPDVRTLREMGYHAATIVPLGFACPSAVPAEIRARLERVVTLAAADPELQATMKSLIMRPKEMTAAQFHDAIRSQAATVEGILTAAGMKKV